MKVLYQGIDQDLDGEAVRIKLEKLDSILEKTPEECYNLLVSLPVAGYLHRSEDGSYMDLKEDYVGITYKLKSEDEIFDFYEKKEPDSNYLQEVKSRIKQFYEKNRTDGDPNKMDPPASLANFIEDLKRCEYEVKEGIFTTSSWIGRRMLGREIQYDFEYPSEYKRKAEDDLGEIIYCGSWICKGWEQDLVFFDPLDQSRKFEGRDLNEEEKKKEYVSELGLPETATWEDIFNMKLKQKREELGLPEDTDRSIIAMEEKKRYIAEKLGLPNDTPLEELEKKAYEEFSRVLNLPKTGTPGQIRKIVIGITLQRGSPSRKKYRGRRKRQARQNDKLNYRNRLINAGKKSKGNSIRDLDNELNQLQQTEAEIKALCAEAEEELGETEKEN